MAGTPEQVGQAFLQTYYNSFRGTPEQRNALLNLYGDNSVIHWEGKSYQGKQIQENFERIAPKSTFEFLNVDPTIQACSDGILLSVTGHLKVDNQLLGGFSHTFMLKLAANQNWFIQNEIFKLLMR